MPEVVESRDYFRQFAQPAASLHDFMQRYCKPNFYAERDECVRRAKLAAKKREIQKNGYATFSPHDTISGTLAAYYPAVQGVVATKVGNCGYQPSI